MSSVKTHSWSGSLPEAMADCSWERLTLGWECVNIWVFSDTNFVPEASCQFWEMHRVCLHRYESHIFVLSQTELNAKSCSTFRAWKRKLESLDSLFCSGMWHPLVKMSVSKHTQILFSKILVSSTQYYMFWKKNAGVLFNLLFKTHMVQRTRLLQTSPVSFRWGSTLILCLDKSTDTGMKTAP